MLPDADALLWALLGNLVVGLGAGTATLAAFSPSLPVVGAAHPAIRVGVVSVGFGMFFAGYHISQVGTYRDPNESVLAALLPTTGDPTDDGGSTAATVFRGGFVVLGVVGLGAGMRLFALTIQAWNGTLGVLTGVVCIGGYICGHIGINGVLL